LNATGWIAEARTALDGLSPSTSMRIGIKGL
jgi:hypothetical protein